VARAKRTDRAEARRRHRAELAELAEAAAAEAQVDEDETSDSSTSDAVRPPRAAASAASKTAASNPRGQRVGFMAGFREAYKIADVRADLRAFPTLVRGRSFLIPVGLSVASTIVGLISISTPNVVGALAVPLFLGPLPIGSIYIAGVLAPRAAYLMGGIASLVGTVGLVIYSVAGAPAGNIPTGDLAFAVGYAVVFYTFFGALIGAGLGFYRRLLRAMNPTDGRPQRAKPGTKGRPSARTAGSKAR